ncbi:MAG: arabinofuranosidase catalytic domain-containing protein [Armatimonadota bacterium]|nr:hypothetical protein [Armatimonadota bacterium]MDW8026611.1 arabinofuranosidase catalytic domain-containing protein [Armatimonadota bacterium]
MVRRKGWVYPVKWLVAICISLLMVWLIFVAVQIVAAPPSVVARFVFEGTGVGENAIALFGHAFPRGAIPKNAPVVLRDPTNGRLYRLQMDPLIHWPDGSVKTALLAAELPMLADGETLELEMVVGQAHPNLGVPLEFSSMLKGRSARIKTWAPGNKNTPLWEFDPLAHIGADRWHNGPLALSTRVETTVPSHAVLDTSNRAGVVESVRLIVDVIVTKDGILELDVCFSNDRLPFRGSLDEPIPKCGIARFGYTIEIDGKVVYDQRPESGPGRDLLMWSQWIKRRGRRSDGLVIHSHAHWREAAARPFVRPDIRTIIASGIIANYDLEGNVDPLLGIPDKGDVDPSVISDPYWHWSLARYAGMGGGRPEIGYRHQYTFTWLRTGHRVPQIWMQKVFEAASTRGMYYYDWQSKRWANPEDYPKLSLTMHSQSPVGTLRSEALGLPKELRPTHNDREHITIDHAHHGSYYWGPALLAGRRLAYDGLAARALWATMDQQDRWNGVSLPPEWGGPNWRTLKPDHTTGVAWSGIVGYNQVRSWGWDLRDIVDAAAILPENWSHRELYVRNAEAWLNHAALAADILNARHGVGFFHLHTYSGEHTVPWMMMFGVTAVITARSAGIAPEATEKLFCEMARFVAGGFTQPDNFYRQIMAARDIRMRSGNRYFKGWAEIKVENQKPTGLWDPIPDDWSKGVSERDWQRNIQVALTYFATDRKLPLEIRAMAADALVLARSERGNPIIDQPALDPEGFFGGFAQTNSLIAPGLTWNLNRAPQIEVGQVFVVPGDAKPGTIVGVVNWTGPTPRCSAQGLNAPEDAFEIVEQPEGNPFTISRGGVLRLMDSLPAGTYTLKIRARTYSRPREGPETVYISEPVPVTVKVTSVAPSIPKTGPYRVMESRPVGFVIAEFFVLGNPGAVEIVSGNKGGLFRVSSPPKRQRAQLLVAAPLVGLAGQSRDLRVRAKNPAGVAEQTIRVEIAPVVDPPALAQNLILNVVETKEAGVLVGEIANAGGLPEKVAIVAGDPYRQFTVTLEGKAIRLRSGPKGLKRLMVHGPQRLLANHTAKLTVEASNVAGDSATTVTVNVRHNSVFDAKAPNAILLGAWSIARRLINHYQGPLIRVRRSLDNAEKDIGFDVNGVLDVAALLAFVGDSDGFVARVYDQSAESLPMVQEDVNQQPCIVRRGKLIVIGANRRPAMELALDRTQSFLQAGPGIPYFITEFAFAPWELAMAVVVQPAKVENSLIVRMRNGRSDSGAGILSDGGMFVFRDGMPGFVISAAKTYQPDKTYVLLGRLQRDAPKPEHRSRFVIFGPEGILVGHGVYNPFDSWGSELAWGWFRGCTAELLLFRRLGIEEERAILENMADFYGIN